MISGLKLYVAGLNDGIWWS